jgi:hypothetical protein
LPPIIPVRIAAHGDDVAFTSVFGRKLLKISALKFRRRQVFRGLNLFEAL